MCYLILFIGFLINFISFFLFFTPIGSTLIVYYPNFSYLLVFVYLIPSIYLIKNNEKRKSKKVLFIIGNCIFLVILSIMPLISIPFIVYDVESQMFANYGTDYINLNTNRMLNNPFSFWKSLHGISLNLQDLDINLDILYYNNSNDYFYFDWYKPKGGGPFPVIILLHGGSWVTGNKGVKNNMQLSMYLASQGYCVFDIQYGVYMSASEANSDYEDYLRPDYNRSYLIPDQVENVGKFTHFLAKNHLLYNADIDNVFIMGRSAGGHVAGVVGTGYNNSYFSGTFNESLNLRGMILLYPITNLKTLKYAAEIGLTFWESWFFDALLNNSLSQNELQLRYNFYSPYYLLQNQSAKIPPILLLFGMSDLICPYLDQGFNFRQEALRNNRTCILVSLPFIGHSIDLFMNSHAGQISTYYIERFLALETN